jgi:hypothetical protein
LSIKVGVQSQKFTASFVQFSITPSTESKLNISSIINNDMGVKNLGIFDFDSVLGVIENCMQLVVNFCNYTLTFIDKYHMIDKMFVCENPPFYQNKSNEVIINTDTGVRTH